jgi:hypothetical protein
MNIVFLFIKIKDYLKIIKIFIMSYTIYIFIFIF